MNHPFLCVIKQNIILENVVRTLGICFSTVVAVLSFYRFFEWCSDDTGLGPPWWCSHNGTLLQQHVQRFFFGLYLENPNSEVLPYVSCFEKQEKQISSVCHICCSELAHVLMQSLGYFIFAQGILRSFVKSWNFTNFNKV